MTDLKKVYDDLIIINLYEGRKLDGLDFDLDSTNSERPVRLAYLEAFKSVETWSEFIIQSHFFFVFPSQLFQTFCQMLNY